jgi:hypothetical protein
VGLSLERKGAEGKKGDVMGVAQHDASAADARCKVVENADTEIARDGRVHGVAALVLHDLRRSYITRDQAVVHHQMRRALGEEEEDGSSRKKRKAVRGRSPAGR